MMNSDSTNRPRRTNRAFAAALAVLLVLTLTSCRRKAVRVTDEEAMPVQTVIDAQAKLDATLYISAFPPDFIAAARASCELTEGVTLEEFLTNSYIVPAAENCETNYGKGFGYEYLVHAILEYPAEENERDFAKYIDYNVIDYDMDVTKIQKSVKAVGTLNSWGDDAEDSDSATYVLIQIDGVWYLHPMYFLTVY